MLTAPLVWQVVMAVPATAVVAVPTVTEVVLLATTALLQAEDSILVITILVVPTLSVEVLNVPIFGVPAVTVAVAVLPMAMVAPLRL